MFADLVFFSEQLISTGETPLSAPFTIVFLGIEFTLQQSVTKTGKTYFCFSISTIETFESSAGSEFIVAWRSPSAGPTTRVSKSRKEESERRAGYSGEEDRDSKTG